MIDMDKYNPDACPSCGSMHIYIYDEAADSRNVWKYLACNDCKQRWNEEYTLSSAWMAEQEDN